MQVKIMINPDICSGCATCVDGCPVPTIAFNEEKQIPYVIDLEGCLICRTCEALCPSGAIKVDFPGCELKTDMDLGI
jgi:NAD-dependent dihydropyrimidine dehydrogenase PreA subunit